jgi:hypothetical protein
VSGHEGKSEVVLRFLKGSREEVDEFSIRREIISRIYNFKLAHLKKNPPQESRVSLLVDHGDRQIYQTVQITFRRNTTNIACQDYSTLSRHVGASFAFLSAEKNVAFLAVIFLTRSIRLVLHCFLIDVASPVWSLRRIVQF